MSADILTRALGYPYALPGSSYIVHKDAVHPMPATETENLRIGRVPVLAVGSNQSPEQIKRKFTGPDWLPIPCERCWLEDFDTVYSAHITAYGSIAAALHSSPGTRVSLYINWLDESHLPRMHETELGNENYVFAELDGIRLRTEFGLDISRVFFYRSNAGAFAPNGQPIPLAEVPAENRRWHAMHQRDVQSHVHQQVSPDHSFDDYVLSSVSNAGLRRQRAGTMRSQTIDFEHPGLRILLD